MGRELELMAREIDPMAWKAWENTPEIQTRRTISIEKARTALRRIRKIGDVALSRGASAISGAEEARASEVAQATWAAIVDAITERRE
ncbi:MULTISPECIES: hypothetical protein [unclassified Sphingopyxis]|uniref:hypothetical protein n=1 Tax=unclassified Sphingopyxis TaxID=2614943 RepID=UPI00073690D0|nr:MULTISPECIES: hypothetical protein [unclassified Sphingopyxis]KTE36429.1 hypothetical protein ATE62_14635 [Sphingopyxis sp. HIX]KTE83821.1 hypothetical protein ATE72_11790 [Sphingopyxis sp. HXXIV]